MLNTCMAYEQAIPHKYISEGNDVYVRKKMYKIVHCHIPHNIYNMEFINIPIKCR